MDVCEKFCVLQIRNAWFALPAMSVREVFTRPALVSLPGTHSVVEGLCHLRTEFLPVLRLAALVGEDETATTASDGQILVLTSASGPLGVSVDRVVALEALEVAINFDEHDRSSIVMGSANYRDQVVRVLNHAALVRRAQGWMNEYWENERAVLCG